jgi:hypothetical protein
MSGRTASITRRLPLGAMIGQAVVAAACSPAGRIGDRSASPSAVPALIRIGRRDLELPSG